MALTFSFLGHLDRYILFVRFSLFCSKQTVSTNGFRELEKVNDLSFSKDEDEASKSLASQSVDSFARERTIEGVQFCLSPNKQIKMILFRENETVRKS